MACLHLFCFSVAGTEKKISFNVPILFWLLLLWFTYFINPVKNHMCFLWPHSNHLADTAPPSFYSETLLNAETRVTSCILREASALLWLAVLQVSTQVRQTFCCLWQLKVNMTSGSWNQTLLMAAAVSSTFSVARRLLLAAFLPNSTAYSIIIKNKNLFELF